MANYYKDTLNAWNLEAYYCCHGHVLESAANHITGEWFSIVNFWNNVRQALLCPTSLFGSFEVMVSTDAAALINSQRLIETFQSIRDNNLSWNLM